MKAKPPYQKTVAFELRSRLKYGVGLHWYRRFNYDAWEMEHWGMTAAEVIKAKYGDNFILEYDVEARIEQFMSTVRE